MFLSAEMRALRIQYLFLLHSSFVFTHSLPFSITFFFFFSHSTIDSLASALRFVYFIFHFSTFSLSLLSFLSRFCSLYILVSLSCIHSILLTSSLCQSDVNLGIISILFVADYVHFFFSDCKNYISNLLCCALCISVPFASQTRVRKKVGNLMRLILASDSTLMYLRQ